MAWQIAIVVDESDTIETFHAHLSILLGQMPVWTITHPYRVPLASKLREQWNNCWYPEPALTLVRPTPGHDRVGEIADLIPTIQEHHYRMTAVRLFGIDISEALTRNLDALGFHPISGTSWDGLGFARHLSEIEDVPVIRLDATAWNSTNDFYSAFFDAVGAPPWHGRNLNALNDSIGGSAVNKMEVPYRLVVHNLQTADAEVRYLLRDFAELIEKLRLNGCPVEIQIEP